ncbi:glucuronate isomerase [Niabella yanshanensis]|uniref:Uronate isomerase n=1 Tax=Niabella yanshanensis TaxID=577386 RepID=A0ABZ0WC84_9BACT|nr:glucuronate isomerase [Niabella yanshanensis]WQD40348.1 glucuronate isomerase [Niabella yanshanensis]
MAKQFLDENFLLETKTAQTLYHEYAKQMPIIDYHCHLPPDQIANDKQFENLTQIWLYGDHYKWRAMRTNGVDEAYCTGNKSDYEKFEKWAETVPYTMRNPLYHWTHMELQRYFDVHDILDASTARKIYDECTAKLQTPEYSVRNLLRKMNVKTVCTTDDPVDSLEHHQKVKDDGFEIPIIPAWRPDNAMNVANAANFVTYTKKLEAASGVHIVFFKDFLDALKKRHDFFATMGCSVSDHGLEQIYAEDYTEHEIHEIFDKVYGGHELNMEEQNKFRSAMLVYFAEWDHEKGWVQQFHLGAIRNNNLKAMRELGPDTGWDSIGDFPQARAISKFLGGLIDRDKLTKTILYNLNPADNELMATMIGNFNDGSAPGKIQWGSGWWFLDQKDGMIRQMNALSNMGLLSKFVGMLTDSRSFLSFPRHEYFRRILCNLFGNDVENGELPVNMEWIGQVIQDICFNNANNYFNLQLK